MMHKRVFKYYDGQIVRVGDRIKTGNAHVAVVKLVIQPDSEDAIFYSCETTGGVLVCEKWPRGDSLVLNTPPDAIYWEDWELIARGEKSIITRLLSLMKKRHV